MDDHETPQQSDTKPPYGGFGTFWNFVDQQRELFVDGHFPQIIDRSVMANRGGSARSELYIALRFFGLIDEDKRPTERFKAIVADMTKAQLRTLVETAYADVIALNLMTATPRQVDEAMSKLGASPSTISRTRTFFLNAADEAGIPVGAMLKAAPRARTASGPRKRAPKKPVTEVAPEAPEPVVAVPSLIGALVEKLPSGESGWTQGEARAWLSLMEQAIAYEYGIDLLPTIREIRHE